MKRKISDFIFDCFEIEVTVTTACENPCLHIDKSYRVKKSKHIKWMLEYIHESEQYQALQKSGYTRTFESEYREWKAHNVLYRLGICRGRTESCDIDQNEPKWKRVGYAILSIF